MEPGKDDRQTTTSHTYLAFSQQALQPLDLFPEVSHPLLLVALHQIPPAAAAGGPHPLHHLLILLLLPIYPLIFGARIVAFQSSKVGFKGTMLPVLELA
jgi:hypothetical protein